jgi:uncharacterized integral membrane protein
LLGVDFMLFIVLSLIFSIIVALFALQNAGMVMIHFLWYQINLSQAVVILGSTLVGVIIVMPFYLFKIVKYKIDFMELKSEMTGLKRELEEFKLKKQTADLNIENNTILDKPKEDK